MYVHRNYPKNLFVKCYYCKQHHIETINVTSIYMQAFKNVRAKIFQSIYFFKLLLQSDNEILVSEMQKNWGSETSFQR